MKNTTEFKNKPKHCGQKKSLIQISSEKYMIKEIKKELDYESTRKNTQVYR